MSDLSQLIEQTQRPIRKLWDIAPPSGRITENAEIGGICDDSRHIQPGEAFLCLPRAGSEATRYIAKAAKAGAAAAIIIGQDKLKITKLPCLYLDNMEEAGRCLRKWFKTVRTKVPLFGVTGTDGKTSIAWMLREALQKLHGSAWSVGTLGFVKAPDDILDIGNTTPSLLTNHRLLALAQTKKIGALVMEVSSHGIAQKRIAGLDFTAAAWTNLGHDHLQDHGGYDAYAAIKQGFIRQVAESKKPVICNADSAEIKRLMSKIGGDVRWYGHGLYQQGLFMRWEQELPGLLRLATDEEEVRIEDIPLGDFHAENMAATASLLCASLDVPLKDTPALLEGISAPPGRLQGLDIGRWKVFIDYAHTPEALERCLTTLRKLTTGRLITVFGCGGERDREKRPQMGRIASLLSDIVWITSDNPRSELPEVIASEIENGMPHPYTAKVHLQLDRAEAIRAAVACMQPQDCLVIAGKGHENYMEIAERRIPWSDTEIATGALHEKEAEGLKACA